MFMTQIVSDHRPAIQVYAAPLCGDVLSRRRRTTLFNNFRYEHVAAQAATYSPVAAGRRCSIISAMSPAPLCGDVCFQTGCTGRVLHPFDGFLLNLADSFFGQVKNITNFFQ